MRVVEFWVRKEAIADTRFAERDAPMLQENELLINVNRFALTTNNISYGALGNNLGYWDFFPAAEGWGIIPAWGIGQVIETKHPDVRLGELLYGYFPMASCLRITAGKVSPGRLVDTAAHRSQLAAVYNNYIRLDSDPNYDHLLDNERVVLLPLYATSYCVYDFVCDNRWFLASQIIVVSASSKTALGFAYARGEDRAAPKCIGVTSARNTATVQQIGLYDDVIAYENIGSLNPSISTLIIDFSGDNVFLSRLHDYFGDNMNHCLLIGGTHARAGQEQPVFSKRANAFFAPGHIKKRAGEWGRGQFEKRSSDFWRRTAIKSRDWLTIEQHDGAEPLRDIFQIVRVGDIEPSRAIVASL